MWRKSTAGACRRSCCTRKDPSRNTLMKSSAYILMAAALAAGSAFAQVSEISYDSAPNLLKMPPDTYLGAVGGVATNSKGHIYVYTRTGDAYATTGTSRTFT